MNLSQLLNDKVGEGVRSTRRPTGRCEDASGGWRSIAADRGRISQLMYDRWVRAQRRRRVEGERRQARLHPHPEHGRSGARSRSCALYSDNFDKEAIVLDVRYNGGGFTHDQVLNYLAGKEHTFFRQRDGGEGLVLRNDRKWTKPLVVMINNRSYSRRRDLPARLPHAGAGQAGRPGDRRLRDRHHVHAAHRRLDLPHAAHRRVHECGA